MSAAEVTALVAQLPGALDAAAQTLGPQLAAAIAAPAVKRGVRDLLSSPDVKAGVDAVAWRVGLVVGGCIVGAIVLGTLAGRAASR